MKKSFKKILEKNYKEYCKWPLWKRKIIINSNSISTSRYIGEDLKRKKI
jgi:hypothetical protein